MTLSSEKDLILDMTRGDSRAFDQLYLHYYPVVYRFIFGFIKSEKDTEDLSQDIFYKIWTNQSRFEHLESIKPYLFKMAKNAVFAHYNKEQIHSRALMTIKETDSQYSLEPEFYARELETMIDQALSTMSERRQQIFKMSRHEGLSNEEIALRLKISKRTVENTLSLVIKELGTVVYIFALLMNIK
ncbi:MAG: RNA polymerase sigma-70 factor [Bacteroidales bacterium]